MIGWLLDTNVLSELRRPRPEPKVLAFVAATALHHDLTLVSRDSGDFENARVRLFNPWVAD